jgi:hypothetical protein
MKWYYTLEGSHVRVRVFMNRGKCGDLCFRLEEFEQITQFDLRHLNRPTSFVRTLSDKVTITFINETPTLNHRES